jgi:hypothetical protein
MVSLPGVVVVSGSTVFPVEFLIAPSFLVMAAITSSALTLLFYWAIKSRSYGFIHKPSNLDYGSVFGSNLLAQT